MTLLIDEDLEQAEDGAGTFRYSGTARGVVDEPLARVLEREAAPASVRLSLRGDSSPLSDRVIGSRRWSGPQCLPRLHLEVVPADDPSRRRRSVQPVLEVQS